MKEVFISYAHDNLEDREELIKHLSVLKRNGLINEWSDKELVAGQDWDRAIKKNLEDADIVLFLVSSEFLASDYINNVEVEETIKKYHENSIKVFPVILNNCMWQETILNKFQAVPSEKGRLKPISEWTNRNDAFYTVSIELMKSIKGKEPKNFQLEKLYDYKKVVSKWESKSKANHSSFSLDNLFKLLLIISLISCSAGCFYSMLFMSGELQERLPIIFMFFAGMAVSMAAYFLWRLIELKYLNQELNN